MEKRIALEKRGREEAEIKELNLDNCKSTAIEGLTDKFTALETLSLINVGLTSLKNFPALPNLKRLELSDNRLSGGLTNITNCPNLQTLNMSGNRIKDLEEIRPLAALPKLEVLDLFNNDITHVEDYREKMFEILGKSLKYLDGFDQNEVEAPSDADDEENGNGSEEDYDDSDEEDNGLSLAEVYNDELEDDQDSWNGEDEIEDEEEDLDEDEDGEDETPNNSTSDAGAAAESTQGKKRKHDDD